MKLRAEHCGVQFTVLRITERMVDEERYVRCIMCGERTAHVWDPDLDRWDNMRDILLNTYGPPEAPIELVRMLGYEWFETYQTMPMVKYIHQRLEEDE